MHLLTSTRDKAVELLWSFNTSPDADVRSQVISLIPVWSELCVLGQAVIPDGLKLAARDRILFYFQRYPGTVISKDELMVVSGISEWARRLRELRRELGWAIINGTAARLMQSAGDLPGAQEGFADCSTMGPHDYIMLHTVQDREAAFRWRLANEIRKEKSLGVKRRLLEYLKQNFGYPVTGDELSYVAKDQRNWPRRVRELRTEDGWSVCTRWNGRPDLPTGVYILESLRQLPKHDRHIPDGVRRAVLQRDYYRCTECGWGREDWNADDPRHLEAHHLQAHVDGGTNTADNLLTLCNVCHDRCHACADPG